MVIVPAWWKRWPTVAAPLLIVVAPPAAKPVPTFAGDAPWTPAISNATISSPRRATMPWRGRTQRRLSVEAEASPQRIDLGQGKARTIAGIASARSAAVGRPGFSTIAKRMPSRSSSWSRVRPVLRRKPSSACGGAEARGPLVSSRTAAVSAGRPPAVAGRRRGGRGGAGALGLLGGGGGLGGEAAGDEGEAGGGGVGLDRPGLQPRLAELSLEQPRKVGARLVLHSRGDFLGKELEEEISHEDPPRDGEGDRRAKRGGG